MDVAPVAPIRLVIRAPVPAEVAWAYVTDPDRVEEWFTAASPVGAVGESYVLDFGEGSVVQGAIVELEPGRRFAHRWAWLDAEPGQETLVTWVVRPLEDGGAEIELRRFFRQSRGIDEPGAHLGKIALATGRKSAHQEVAHRQIEHRIAEKLQDFVVVGAVIALVGNMSERPREKRRIGKTVAQFFL